MGLFRRADSPFWWWSVSVQGHRLRGSCETADRAQAEGVLKRQRARLRREWAPGRKPEITLNEAFVRYWQEHAERLPSADNIARIGEVVIAGLGTDTLLSRISADDVARFVARRRAAVSDASVNRELTILRAVMRQAALRWGAAVTTIDWKRQWLLEPAPRDRVLSTEEEERLFAALRLDFHPLIKFALATGMRFDNIRRLRWSQIDWDARVIRLRVKSRRPGGDTHAVPLTAAIAAILSAEQGRHREFVFTYIPQRARSDERRARAHIEGARAPFTRDGWRKSWEEALEEAGLEDLRFHDLRHTTATRLYRASGNLRLVQKLLGHRSIETTLRYENSDVADLAAALEAIERDRRGPFRKRRDG